MKTYVCDICGEVVNNPMKHISMREVFFKRKPFKKEKIHLCQECLWQIAKNSHKKRSDTE